MNKASCKYITEMSNMSDGKLIILMLEKYGVCGTINLTDEQIEEYYNEVMYKCGHYRGKVCSKSCKYFDFCSRNPYKNR